MAALSFFQEITIGGKVYSSLDDLIKLKGELEQQLQQKRVEAGQDVDQTLRLVAMHQQKEQDVRSQLMNTEALLKRASDSLVYMTEQRQVINTEITAAKAEVDQAVNVVVEAKNKLREAEAALANKQTCYRMAGDKLKDNESKITNIKPEIVRLDKVKAFAQKDLATVTLERAVFSKSLNPAKEQWKQLDANLKLVTLLVATLPASPPPPSQPMAPQVTAPQVEKTVEEGADESAKEHKKKKHRQSAVEVAT